VSDGQFVSENPAKWTGMAHERWAQPDFTIGRTVKVKYGERPEARQKICSQELPERGTMSPPIWNAQLMNFGQGKERTVNSWDII